MIQLILNWDGDWETIVSPYHAKAIINEMVENTYLVLLNEPDDFDALETEMELQEDVFVVGSYNMDGTQYTYGNINRNHTISKYTLKLRGSLTESEALSTQVNKIYGQPNRILT